MAHRRSCPHTAVSRTQKDGTPHSPSENISSRLCSATSRHDSSSKARQACAQDRFARSTILRKPRVLPAKLAASVEGGAG